MVEDPEICLLLVLSFVSDRSLNVLKDLVNVLVVSLALGEKLEVDTSNDTLDIAPIASHARYFLEIVFTTFSFLFEPLAPFESARARYYELLDLLQWYVEFILLIFAKNLRLILCSKLMLVKNIERSRKLQLKHLAVTSI